MTPSLLARVSLAAALLMACTSKVEPATPAPTKTPAPEALTDPETPRAEAPSDPAEALTGLAEALADPAMQTPWTIRYSDGANNHYTISRPKADGPASFVYDPVKPAESSSGVYDGGPPAKGALSDAQTEALWGALRTLQAEGDRHTQQRTKGSGAIDWETPAGAVSFLVRMGAADQLEATLLELRAATPQPSSGTAPD